INMRPAVVRCQRRYYGRDRSKAGYIGPCAPRCSSDAPDADRFPMGWVRVRKSKARQSQGRLVVTSDSTLANSRIFYGWVVVAAAFAVTFVGFGSAYTFSAFVGSLQNEFGASRGSVSLGFSLSGVLYFGLGRVSGPLADRWGSRRLALVGMILTGLGLALAGAAR